MAGKKRPFDLLIYSSVMAIHRMRKHIFQFSLTFKKRSACTFIRTVKTIRAVNRYLHVCTNVYELDIQYKNENRKLFYQRCIRISTSWVVLMHRSLTSTNPSPSYIFFLFPWYERVSQTGSMLSFIFNTIIRSAYKYPLDLILNSHLIIVAVIYWILNGQFSVR